MNGILKVISTDCGAPSDIVNIPGVICYYPDSRLGGGSHKSGYQPGVRYDIFIGKMYWLQLATLNFLLTEANGMWL
jgi:hypothetical protein